MEKEKDDRERMEILEKIAIAEKQILSGKGVENKEAYQQILKRILK